MAVRWSWANAMRALFVIQRAARAGETAEQSAARDAQNARRLAMVEPFERDEQQRLALVQRQAEERRLQPRLPDEGGRQRSGDQRRAGAAQALRAGGFARLAVQLGDGRV